MQKKTQELVICPKPPELEPDTRFDKLGFMENVLTPMKKKIERNVWVSKKAEAKEAEEEALREAQEREQSWVELIRKWSGEEEEDK